MQVQFLGIVPPSLNGVCKQWETNVRQYESWDHCEVRPVEMEYREMLFRLETEHSDKELYWIIAQSKPVQMISY